MNYLEYVTKEGDRVDLISFYFFGTFYRYPEILLENPALLQHPITPILRGGLLLKIPASNLQAVKIDPALLPPWRR